MSPGSGRHSVEVDRDTVMKIGRHCRPKRTFNWPPPSTTGFDNPSQHQPQEQQKGTWDDHSKPRFQSLDNTDFLRRETSASPSTIMTARVQVTSPSASTPSNRRWGREEEAKSTTTSKTSPRRDWSLDSRTLTVTRLSCSPRRESSSNLDLDDSSAQRPGQEQMQTIRGRLEDTLKFDRYYPVPDNKCMFIELSPSPSASHRSFTAPTHRSRSVSLSRDILHADPSNQMRHSAAHSGIQSTTKNKQGSNHSSGAVRGEPIDQQMIIRSCSLTELPPIKPRKLVSPSITAYDNQNVSNCHQQRNSSSSITANCPSSSAAHTVINASQVHRQRRSKSAESRLIVTSATGAEENERPTSHRKMIDNACPSQDHQGDDKLSAFPVKHHQEQCYYSKPEKKLDLGSIVVAPNLSAPRAVSEEKSNTNDEMAISRVSETQTQERATNMQPRSGLAGAMKNCETQQQEATQKTTSTITTAVGIQSRTKTSERKKLKDDEDNDQDVVAAKNRPVYLDTGQQQELGESYYYYKNLHLLLPENDNFLHAELVNLSDNSSRSSSNDSSSCCGEGGGRSRPGEVNDAVSGPGSAAYNCQTDKRKRSTANRQREVESIEIPNQWSVGPDEGVVGGKGTRPPQPILRVEPQNTKPDGIERCPSHPLPRQYSKQRQGEPSRTQKNVNDSFGPGQVPRPVGQSNNGTGTGAKSQLLICSKDNDGLKYASCSPEVGQSDGILDEPGDASSTVHTAVNDGDAVRQQITVDDPTEGGKQQQNRHGRNKCDCYNNCKCQRAAKPESGTGGGGEVGGGGATAGQQQRVLFNNANPIGILINGPRQPDTTASTYTQLTRPSDAAHHNDQLRHHEKWAGGFYDRTIDQHRCGSNDNITEMVEGIRKSSQRDWHRGRESPKEIIKAKVIAPESTAGGDQQRNKNISLAQQVRSASSPAEMGDKNKCSKINVGQIKATLQPTMRPDLEPAEEEEDEGGIRGRPKLDENVIGNRDIFHNKPRTSSRGGGSQEHIYEQIPPDGIRLISYSSNFPLSSPVNPSKAKYYYYPPAAAECPPVTSLRTAAAVTVAQQTFPEKSIHSQSHPQDEQQHDDDLAGLVTRIGTKQQPQNGDNEILSLGVVGCVGGKELAKQKPLKSTAAMTTMTCPNETRSLCQQPRMKGRGRCLSIDKAPGDSVFNQNSSYSYSTVGVQQSRNRPRSLDGQMGRGAVNPSNRNEMVSSLPSSSSHDDKSDFALLPKMVSPSTPPPLLPPLLGRSGSQPPSKMGIIAGTDSMAETKQMPPWKRVLGSHTGDMIASSAPTTTIRASPTSHTSMDEAAASATAPDLIELESAITDLIDFAGIVRRRPQIMNPLYVPVIESCLHDLALLVLAQREEEDQENYTSSITTSGKLNIPGNTGASSYNNKNDAADEVNPIGRSSVPVLMDLLRYLADSSSTSSSTSSPSAGLSADARVNEKRANKRGKRLLEDPKQWKTNNNNLENSLDMTKIENQNTISSEVDDKMEENKMVMRTTFHPQGDTEGEKETISKPSMETATSSSAFSSVPSSIKSSIAQRKRKHSCSSSMVASPDSNIFANTAVCRQGLAAVQEDATTMAMALDYLKTMTKNLRETQIDNDKVNNQPASSQPITKQPPSATSLRQSSPSPPPSALPSHLHQRSLPSSTSPSLSCDRMSRSSSITTQTSNVEASRASVLMMGCQDDKRQARERADGYDSNKPFRDPRICKEIIESGNFGNVIPMSSFRLPTASTSAPHPTPVAPPVLNSIPIPPPPPLPTHLFCNTPTRIRANGGDDDKQEQEDASTSLGNNRGDIISRSSSRSGSIIQAPNPPIRRHFTHSTHPQIMLRQQREQHQHQQRASSVSSRHYRIDSGATQSEFNIRQNMGEERQRTGEDIEGQKASFASVVTTVTRTFDLNAEGGVNAGPASGNHQPGRNQGHTEPFLWNDQARDTSLNAIVAPECDRNVESGGGGGRAVVILPNIAGYGGGGTIKRSFSGDNGRVVDKCTWIGQCNFDAITDSRRPSLVALDMQQIDDDHVEDDGATAAADTIDGRRETREYDIDSLLLSGGYKTCVDKDCYDVDDVEDNHSTGGGGCEGSGTQRNPISICIFPVSPLHNIIHPTFTSPICLVHGLIIVITVIMNVPLLTHFLILDPLVHL